MSGLIFENIEFHNVAELDSVPGLAGLRLQRFPEAVRNKLGDHQHQRGRFYSQISVGCEIRFVTDAHFVKISLSSLENQGEVYVYKGEFLHSVHSLAPGVVTTLHLDEPPKFKEVDPQRLHATNFSPQVWRLLFGKNSTICFHALDTFGHGCRPPLAEEKPAYTMLAYGSSITFGGDTNLYTNAYIQQTARRLGWDVLNKGIAGSCFCEQEIAGYLSSLTSDLVVLELGVNMRGRFTAEEFEQRVDALITKIRQKSPSKPVVVLSIFPNSASVPLQPAGSLAQANQSLNDILAKLTNSRQDPALYYIPGSEILTTFSGLTTDLLHPSDDGHISMGENLASQLRTLLKNK